MLRIFDFIFDFGITFLIALRLNWSCLWLCKMGRAWVAQGTDAKCGTFHFRFRKEACTWYTSEQNSTLIKWCYSLWVFGGFMLCLVWLNSQAIKIYAIYISRCNFWGISYLSFAWFPWVKVNPRTRRMSVHRSQRDAVSLLPAPSVLGSFARQWSVIFSSGLSSHSLKTCFVLYVT